MSEVEDILTVPEALRRCPKYSVASPPVYRSATHVKTSCLYTAHKNAALTTKTPRNQQKERVRRRWYSHGARSTPNVSQVFCSITRILSERDRFKILLARQFGFLNSEQNNLVVLDESTHYVIRYVQRLTQENVRSRGHPHGATCTLLILNRRFMNEKWWITSDHKLLTYTAPKQQTDTWYGGVCTVDASRRRPSAVLTYKAPNKQYR